MKTKLPAAFSFFLFCGFCLFDPGVENDLMKLGLKGRVKSFSEFSFKAGTESGEVKKGVRMRRVPWPMDFDKIISFNQQGNKVAEKWFQPDDALMAVWKYTYDEKGRIRESAQFSSGNVEEFRQTLEYGEGGKILEERVFRGGRLITILTRVYDKKGNEIEIIKADSKNVPYAQEKMRYNEKGHKLEHQYFYLDGMEEDTKETFSYDDKGQKIEENQYDAEDILIVKKVFAYDGLGNVSEESHFQGDGYSMGRSTFTHDENRRIIEEKYFKPDGELQHRRTCDYDGHGNKISENFYTADGSLYQPEIFKLDYDEEGNWVKLIEYKDGVPRFVLERKISYYK